MKSRSSKPDRNTGKRQQRRSGSHYTEDSNRHNSFPSGQSNDRNRNHDSKKNPKSTDPIHTGTPGGGKSKESGKSRKTDHSAAKAASNRNRAIPHSAGRTRPLKRKANAMSDASKQENRMYQNTKQDRPIHHTDPAHHHSDSLQSEAVSKYTNTEVPVLYEDNHVIGVIKPINILSQEDASGDMDMLTLIKQDLKIRHQKEGNVFLGLVHRLDRPVGGAMIFAKTSKGASRLSDAVRSGQLMKRYVAVVRGIPSRPKATLRDTLLKDARTNTSTVVRPNTPGGKDAVLDYEVIAVDEQADLALVLIRLHTGRSHQIRVQMSHAGYPLFGDQRYGVHVNRPGEQLALWSILAAAPHPVKDEMIRILSIPPRTRPWNIWPESLYAELTQRLEYEND